jgi:lipoprotein-anchoring transpeptidase ErfK/SrfK
MYARPLRFRLLFAVIGLALIVGVPPSVARGAAPGAGEPPPAPPPNQSLYPSLFPPAPAVGGPARRIVVSLTDQQLAAFEGPTPVRAFDVSTGDALHPTPVGRYTIQHKYAHIDLIGRDYYYHDVPDVMLLARPFYIHAAPWRAEFGLPISRGCVTLSTADADWLFAWAEVGTPVTIRW